jgi:zinc/manganese transport system substrate-binding protein
MRTVFLFTFFILATPALAGAKLKIAATTTDLAALAKEVSAEGIDVFAIAKGTQDAHQLEAKPSFMVKLRDADLVVAHGLELESAWLEPLMKGARNPKLALLELGPLLEPIEAVTGKLSRAEGDVHPGGNPHFQLDPVRMGKAAGILATKLGELEPARKEAFAKNATAFAARLEEKTRDWRARLKKTGVAEVVTYHKTLSYFCARFELRCELHLEPKPGIPPTARHLIGVIDEMKKRNLRVVLIENYFDDTVRAKLEKEVPGVKVLKVPVAVDGVPAATSTETLLETLVTTIETAAR